jgi:flagellar L-ring protein precursor FlgH
MNQFARRPSIRRVLAWRGLAMAAGLLAAGSSWAQSLYDPATFRPLTADQKAFRIGDIVTVQVLENATATANADTGSRRSNSVGANIVHAKSPAVRVGLEANGEFDGGGRTSRTGRLLAQLSVTVREILPNGDLRLEGEQLLTINEEQQRINLEGRARPQDITDGNVVVSTRLAGARITYIGEGDLADRQRPAWWRRALDWFGF